MISNSGSKVDGVNKRKKQNYVFDQQIGIEFVIFDPIYQRTAARIV